jgi:hypothetical protein
MTCSSAPARCTSRNGEGPPKSVIGSGAPTQVNPSDSAETAGGAKPAPIIAGATRRSSAASSAPVAYRLIAPVAAVGHCAPTSRCSAAEDAEDRNSGAEAAAQARMSVAASTARITAGWPNGSSGARDQGGSSQTPPADRGAAGPASVRAAAAPRRRPGRTCRHGRGRTGRRGSS